MLILHRRNLLERCVSSSFHFSFLSKWPKTKKSAVLFVCFVHKKSAFCLKMTADFFVIWCETKNEKWNEPNISRQAWTWIKISRILTIKSRKKRMSRQLISNHQLRSDFSIKLTLVPFIPFFVFWSKWPKNEKISCHFADFFYKK
jgi:hypothetical protein